MIVSRDGSSAFSIHDSFIDVTIPFDREVMALMLALMMALFRELILPTPNSRKKRKNSSGAG